ncbi:MAG: hypothetical protein IPP29_06620 [Bacteroidetes bacterium]|nr:hypothetical protein [Bacteroidota bacterium]
MNQPSYPNILFVGNRGGIDIVDMANTNASVQKLWDMPDAWVSDIHVIGTTLEVHIQYLRPLVAPEYKMNLITIKTILPLPICTNSHGTGLQQP